MLRPLRQGNCPLNLSLGKGNEHPLNDMIVCRSTLSLVIGGMTSDRFVVYKRRVSANHSVAATHIMPFSALFWSVQPPGSIYCNRTRCHLDSHSSNMSCYCFTSPLLQGEIRSFPTPVGSSGFKTRPPLFTAALTKCNVRRLSFSLL